LADLASPEPASELMTLLNAPDPSVRVLGARAMARMRKGPGSTEVQSLLRDPDPEVQAAAIGTLVQWGMAEALPSIEGMAGNPHGEVASSVALAVGRLGVPGNERDLTLLRSLTQHPSCDVRIYAAMGVLRITGSNKKSETALLHEALADRGGTWTGELKEELLEALSFVHERPAEERLNREIILERPVTEMADIRRILEKLGWGLVAEEGTPTWGRLAGGECISVRRLLGRLITALGPEEVAGGLSQLSIRKNEPLSIVPEGNTLRLLPREDALSTWLARLER
jgi:hypothetical protein